jgi:broad specificity phosphatase PhoE
MKTGRFPDGEDSVEHDDRASLSSLAPVERVIVSPARAARETAGWVAQSYEVDPAFDDLDYGRWRGRSIREIAVTDADGIAAWLADPHARPHGGESIAMLAERVNAALERIVRGGRPCMVVTHAIVIKAALAHVRAEPLESVFRIDVAPLSCTRLGHELKPSV